MNGMPKKQNLINKKDLKRLYLLWDRSDNSESSDVNVEQLL